MNPLAQVSPNPRSTVCLLVADADDDTRSLYRESLWLAGCDVVDAADGRDALVKTLVHRARAAGADAVLVKPLSPDALLNELQRLLTRSRDLHSESATHRETAAEGSGRLLAQSAVTERKALAKAHLRFQTTTSLALRVNCSVGRATVRSYTSTATPVESATTIPNNGTTTCVPRRAGHSSIVSARANSVVLPTWCRSDDPDRGEVIMKKPNRRRTDRVLTLRNVEPDARLTDGTIHRPYPAKADIRTDTPFTKAS